MAVGARHYHTPELADAGRVQVYLFDAVSNAWIPHGQALLGRNSQDWFGFSVALSQNGRRLAVSEPGLDGAAGDRAGNVRMFQWVDNLAVWSPLGQELPGEELAGLSGISVVFSGDGRRLAVGSPYFDGEDLNLSGRVRVYQYNANTLSWDTVGGPLDGDQTLDWFGWDVDLSSDGNRICSGAPRNTEYGGFVRCHDFNGTEWNQVGNDIVNDFGDVLLDDRFGLSVSLDGDRVAVGCPAKDAGDRNTGLVAVYVLRDNAWVLMGEPLLGQSFNQQMGFSVQLEGEFLTVGSPGSSSSTGELTFHRWTGSSWDTASTSLKGIQSRDEFGYAIASSKDASIVAAAAPATTSRAPDATGRVVVYQR